MRKSKNINELCHRWAHQTCESDQCGNVSFDGTVLYSWRTGVARVCAGKNGGRFYLFADTNYSSFTSNHMSSARMASDGATFSVRAPERGNTITDIPQLRAGAGEYYFSEIQSCLAYAARRRSPIRMARDIGHARERMEEFKRLQDFIDIENYEDHLKAMNDLLDQYGGPDMQENIRLLRQKITEKEKARIAEQERKLQKAVEIWREGSGSYPRLDYAVLRVCEAWGKLIVETSSSASVPFFHAVRMLFFYRIDPKLVIGRMIGTYKLHSSANGILKIGCHQIRLSEVEMVLGMAIDCPEHFFDCLPVRLDADGQYAERLIRLITKLKNRSNETLDEEE